MFTYCTSNPILTYKDKVDIVDLKCGLDNQCLVDRWDAGKIRSLFSSPPPFYANVDYTVASTYPDTKMPLVYTRDGAVCKTQLDPCYTQNAKACVTLPMFGVLKAGDFYIKGYVPVIRDHLNIPALYSVILDIPSATWQQNEETAWIGRKGDIDEIYLGACNVSADPESRTYELSVYLTISSAGRANATKLGADFAFQSQ